AKLLDREVMAVPPVQEKEGGTSHIMDKPVKPGMYATLDTDSSATTHGTGVEGETDGNTAEGEKRVQQDQSTETGQQQEKEQGRSKAVGRRRGAVLREEECNFLLEIEEDSLESRQKGTQKGTDKQKKGVTKERREKPDMVSIGVGPETPKPQRAPRATLVAKLLDREVMAVPPVQEKEGGTSHIMDSRLSLECTPPLIPTAAQQHMAQVHQA
ncbi:Unconventional myosin-Vb, partial [Nibea albiflora]